MAATPKSIRVRIDPEITTDALQRALLARSDALQKEAASETPGTFKQLMAARLCLEFRNLALELDNK